VQLQARLEPEWDVCSGGSVAYTLFFSKKKKLSLDSLEPGYVNDDNAQLSLTIYGYARASTAASFPVCTLNMQGYRTELNKK
jgi:hypothetical protein